MNDLIQRLREFTVDNGDHLFHPRECQEAADALDQASTREHQAFMAGLIKGQEIESYPIDVEKAWQHYRCKDDTDWKVIETDTLNDRGSDQYANPEVKGND